MTRRLILFIACASLLSGCGFALRGTVTIPAELSRIAVIGSEPDIVDQMERALSSNGVALSTADDKTAAVLNLNESSFERDVRTTDSNGLATSYNLRYRLGYDVRTGKGEELQINQLITQTRFFEYDPLQQLQSEQEEEFLREEMQEEAILQALRRMSRI